MDQMISQAWLVAIQHTLCEYDRAADASRDHDTEFTQQTPQHVA